jgi:hypothetical protein
MTDIVPFDAGLDELLAAAEHAAPNDRVPRYRDPIAAFGTAAVDRLVPWLGHPRLSWFAARTIRRAAELGAKRYAIAALKQALSDGTVTDPGFIREELVALGVIQEIDVPLPAGLALTPTSGKIRVNHVVVDRLNNSGTRWGDLYLVECGWWFSVSWIDKAGGLIAGPTSTGCFRCKQSLEAS